MKRYITIFLLLLLPFTSVACRSDIKSRDIDVIIQRMRTLLKENNADSSSKSKPETEIKEKEKSELSELKPTEEKSQTKEETQAKEKPANENSAEKKKETGEASMETNQIYVTIGKNTWTIALEENESTQALKELLADGPLTISASNYGGFEKVCSLGKKLPKNDSQITTEAGDICLYQGNQIVIFYDSNSWAYTRLGKVLDVEKAELERVLSGKETEITLSLQ